MAAAARRLWSRYEARLAARPLPTKMATSFSLMIAGDVIAQNLDPSGPEKWDVKRTAAMGMCGLCMHAPWFHYWCATPLSPALSPSALSLRSPAAWPAACCPHSLLPWPLIPHPHPSSLLEA